DHGGGPRPERLFVVNGWLREQGLLARPRQADVGLKRSALRLIRRGAKLPIRPLIWSLLPRAARRRVRTLDLAVAQPDWSQTRAYFVRLNFPIGGINVNLCGREPQGIVEPGDDYERARAQVI